MNDFDAMIDGISIDSPTQHECTCGALGDITFNEKTETWPKTTGVDFSSMNNATTMYGAFVPTRAGHYVCSCQTEAKDEAAAKHAMGNFVHFIGASAAILRPLTPAQAASPQPLRLRSATGEVI
jgi:hypothetical protein